MTREDRAKQLPILTVGPRQYRVGQQYVDLNGMDPCHCEDAIWRGVKCKHIIRCEMYEKAFGVLRAD